LLALRTSSTEAPWVRPLFIAVIAVQLVACETRGELEIRIVPPVGKAMPDLVEDQLHVRSNRRRGSDQLVPPPPGAARSNDLADLAQSGRETDAHSGPVEWRIGPAGELQVNLGVDHVPRRLAVTVWIDIDHDHIVSLGDWVGSSKEVGVEMGKLFFGAGHTEETLFLHAVEPKESSQ
jgi:hypothetical protein